MNIDATVEPVEGGFRATAAEFPDCEGIADSEAEALRALQGEILSYIEVAQRMGFPVPDIRGDAF